MSIKIEEVILHTSQKYLKYNSILPSFSSFPSVHLFFTLFQFLPLICCFVLFFSPQLYHATLPLFFPLLCLLTFLGSYLLFGDHRMPVMPRAPDPVPVSFAFSEQTSPVSFLLTREVMAVDAQHTKEGPIPSC